MQIEVTNASNKSRNISLTIFDAEKYKKNNFNLFGPNNITFSNMLTQKYRTYLPVCACTECPLGPDPALLEIIAKGYYLKGDLKKN